jgi:hypothetical protein
LFLSGNMWCGLWKTKLRPELIIEGANECHFIVICHPVILLMTLGWTLVIKTSGLWKEVCNSRVSSTCRWQLVAAILDSESPSIA